MRSPVVFVMSPPAYVLGTLLALTLFGTWRIVAAVVTICVRAPIAGLVAGIAIVTTFAFYGFRI